MNDNIKSQGPKYFIDIEDTQYPWDRSTITTEEIARLGGWNAGQGVLEIDLKDNSERTLSAGQVVELKPGQGFAKKIKFKRGQP